MDPVIHCNGPLNYRFSLLSSSPRSPLNLSVILNCDQLQSCCTILFEFGSGKMWKRFGG